MEFDSDYGDYADYNNHYDYDNDDLNNDLKKNNLFDFDFDFSNKNDNEDKDNKCSICPKCNICHKCDESSNEIPDCHFTNNRGILVLSSFEIYVSNTKYENILYFPWSRSQFKHFNNFEIVFAVKSEKCSLYVRCYEENDQEVLGQTQLIEKCGIYRFPIIKPRDDTILCLQTRIVDSDYPTVICGLHLTYDNPTVKL